MNISELVLKRIQRQVSNVAPWKSVIDFAEVFIASVASTLAAERVDGACDTLPYHCSTLSYSDSTDFGRKFPLFLCCACRRVWLQSGNDGLRHAHQLSCPLDHVWTGGDSVSAHLPLSILAYYAPVAFNACQAVDLSFALALCCGNVTSDQLFFLCTLAHRARHRPINSSRSPNAPLFSVFKDL